MTMLTFEDLMLPLLRVLGDAKDDSVREMDELLAREFELGEELVRELLPSGGQTRFDNRAGWARTFLKKAGLICKGHLLSSSFS